MATYGATKAFILSFTEALWAEMRDQGRRDVRVSCLCPGPTATAFGANVGRDRGRFEVHAVSHCGRGGRGRIGWLGAECAVVIVGRANTAGACLTRFAPRAAVARMSATLLRPQGVPTPRQSKHPRDCPWPRGGRAAIPTGPSPERPNLKLTGPASYSGPIHAKIHSRVTETEQRL